MSDAEHECCLSHESVAKGGSISPAGLLSGAYTASHFTIVLTLLVGWHRHICERPLVGQRLSQHCEDSRYDGRLELG
jgi:hypothetical protein